MKDADEKKLELLYPDAARRFCAVLNKMKALGTPMRITEGLRSIAKQEELYAKGRTNLTFPIVTRAKPGFSYHNYGLAVDMCFQGKIPYPTEDAAWYPFLEALKEEGLTAGAFFPHLRDLPHSQISYGLDINQIKALYDEGGLKLVWSKLDSVRHEPVGVAWAARIKRVEEALGCAETTSDSTS